jgi:hypothetical protein
VRREREKERDRKDREKDKPLSSSFLSLDLKEGFFLLY